MNKNKLQQFLDGELDFDEFQKTRDNGDFMDSYKSLIEQSQTQTPDFNPFKKIETNRKKRISIAKRVLPYAASVLLVLGSFYVVQKYQSHKISTTYNEQEILKIQENTTMALLHFSKELNSCMATFEEVKQMQQAVNEFEKLKESKINSKNPFKNIKIN